MNIKTVVSALAATAALSAIATPIAGADATQDLLKACKITENPRIQELAVDLTLDEPEVFDQINEFRAENNVAPLEFDRTVTKAAVIATHDSVLRGHSPKNHVDTLGRKLEDRLRDCGVPGNWIAENNYESFGTEVSTSGAGAVEFWKGSEGHRKNMLNPKYTKMGVALGYNGEIGQVQDWNRAHWTVVFTD